MRDRKRAERAEEGRSPELSTKKKGKRRSGMTGKGKKKKKKRRRIKRPGKIQLSHNEKKKSTVSGVGGGDHCFSGLKERTRGRGKLSRTKPGKKDPLKSGKKKR